MGIPFGRYLLLRKIASGGMGQVLLARKGEGEFARLVVIKRILPHLVEDEEFFTMFRDEARITMRLDHPNIARLNEFGEENGVHFIEMEYVPGEDLRRVEKLAKKGGGGLPVGAILRVIADCAAGLEYAHEAVDIHGEPLNLVHRDISPQNILVGFDGAVKLIDFGVAKAAGRLQSTATGILKGKFPYMSPEQALGQELDARSDIFSLGIILWELLTGRRLFKADTELASQQRVIKCEVPPPSSLEPTAPKALDAIVLKALARQPEKRFTSAFEFRRALEDYIADAGVPASRNHLTEFMKFLYGDRIARESDPKFLEEDSGLTDVELGGISHSRESTVDGRKGRSSSLPRVRTRTARPAPPPSKTKETLSIIGAIAVVLAGLAVALWPRAEQPGTSPPVTTTRPPPPPVEPGPVEPDPAPPDEPEVRPLPLEVRLESIPTGATLELGGLFVGQTPYDARVEREKLPVAARLSLEGYEPQQLLLTGETGSSLVLTLKKRVVRPNPRLDGSSSNIKTTR